MRKCVIVWHRSEAEATRSGLVHNELNDAVDVVRILDPAIYRDIFGMAENVSGGSGEEAAAVPSEETQTSAEDVEKVEKVTEKVIVEEQT